METIRDVVVRVRLQMTDGDAVKKANGALKEYANGHNRINGQILNGEKQHTEAVKRRSTVNREILNELQQQSIVLDKILFRERQVAKAATERAEAEANAGAGLRGGGGGGVNGGLMDQIKGGRRLIGDIGKIALTPVAVLSIAPAVISQLATITRGLGNDIKGLIGGQEDVARAGLLGGPGFELFDAIKEAFGLGAGGRGGILRDGQPEVAVNAKDAMLAALAREVDLREEHNRLILDSIKVEADLLKQEKAKAEAAREEFGLMDFGQQQTLRDIARKVSAGGVGSLSSGELDFARSSKAFAGLLAEQAKAFADASGFSEILRLLGTTNKINAAEKKVEAKLEAVNEFNIKLDPGRIAEQLEEMLAPKLNELRQAMLAKLNDEIARAVNGVRVAGRPAF